MQLPLPSQVSAIVQGFPSSQITPAAENPLPRHILRWLGTFQGSTCTELLCRSLFRHSYHCSCTSHHLYNRFLPVCIEFCILPLRHRQWRQHTALGDHMNRRCQNKCPFHRRCPCSCNDCRRHMGSLGAYRNRIQDLLFELYQAHLCPGQDSACPGSKHPEVSDPQAVSGPQQNCQPVQDRVLRGP